MKRTALSRAVWPPNVNLAVFICVGLLLLCRASDQDHQETESTRQLQQNTQKQARSLHEWRLQRAVEVAKNDLEDVANSGRVLDNAHKENSQHQLVDWFSSCEELARALENKIPVTSYRDVDARDPAVTRWQIAMALEWALKENWLLRQEVARMEVAKLEAELISSRCSKSASSHPRDAVVHDACMHCWMPACKQAPAPVAEGACPNGKWERIVPTNDAGFEFLEDANVPATRLNGIDVSDLDIRDKVQVHICEQTDLSGTFVVSKLMHCDEHMPFTTDPWFRAAASVSGPDHFELLLQGPEIVALHSSVRHRVGCQYELPYNLTVPGWYHINMGFFRENYAGANELSEAWPASHNDEPLCSGVFRRFGTVAEAPAALERARSHSRPRCRLHPSAEEEGDSAWHESVAAGRWVTTGEAGSELGEEVMADRRELRAENRGFVLRPWVDIDRYNWEPYGCRLGTVTPERARACLRGKRIQFRGDSHMRQLFAALTMVACGTPTEQISSESFCFRPAGACSGAEWEGKLCFVRDTKGTDVGCLLRGAAGGGFGCDGNVTGGITVANFGQHFVAGMSPNKTNAAYRAQVDAYAAVLAGVDASRRRSSFVWVQTTPLAFSKAWWVRGNRDQRSHERLRVMADYADAQMRRLGVRIVPAFNQTLQLGRLQLDTFHYDFSSLARSAVPYLLDIVCPE